MTTVLHVRERRAPRPDAIWEIQEVEAGVRPFISNTTARTVAGWWSLEDPTIDNLANGTPVVAESLLEAIERTARTYFRLGGPGYVSNLKLLERWVVHQIELAGVPAS